MDNLLKPMSDERAQAMRDDLMDGLAYKFTPAVKVQSCTVVPDYARSTYWIEIRGYCPSLRTSVYDKIGVNPLV